MTVRVKVEGLREIQTALHELPKATAKNVMRRVLREVAQPIADHASQNAPVDTGYLKRSVAVSTKLSKRARKDTEKLSDHAVQVYIGPSSAPRATMQEFGTLNHAPQPYMRPAWDAEKGTILPKIAGLMWREIERAAARRARKLARGAAKASAGGSEGDST